MKFTVIFANVDCREPKKVSKRFQEDDRALALPGVTIL